MPTYQLTLEYDGTDFLGWQVQPHGRTVAGTLRDALRAITGEDAAMTAAGRTDRGAHAHGQVVGVTIEARWDPTRLGMALDATLPDDVAVVDAALRADGFDARRDAIDRTYRYVVISRPGRAPVTRRHAWSVHGPLDHASMSGAAQQLVGTHDFAAFGRPTNPGGSTVRTVHRADVSHHATGDSREGPVMDAIVITVRANAFLRGMMRAFAGALVRVGQGRVAESWMRELLGNKTSAGAVPLAPARGLHQWAVTYGSYTLAGSGA